jgi:outer membrane receptor protein involved in Fe transport
VSVSERFIGAVNRETPPTTIDLNRTPAAYYTNVTLRYELPHTVGSPELYLTVNNLFNQAPRITATNAGQGADYLVTSGLYDVIGRYFTFGVKAHL